MLVPLRRCVCGVLALLRFSMLPRGEAGAGRGESRGRCQCRLRHPHQTEGHLQWRCHHRHRLTWQDGVFIHSLSMITLRKIPIGIDFFIVVGARPCTAAVAVAAVHGRVPPR